MRRLRAHDLPDSVLDEPVGTSLRLVASDVAEPGDEGPSGPAAEPVAATRDHTPSPDDPDRPAPRPITEGPGTLIGPYNLREKIGEGGMGIVYLAEQEKPVRRRVALKIIKPGMDTVQVVARFEAERQALALMDHPSIARVLDAGATDTGRPYFVMELIEGVPITDYCDTVHLTPKERLELFIPVCHAIQHAHQKGIIHRDVKPSNVLVTMQDGKPVPKIIDFGIAKAIEQRLTEKTMLTQFGTIVGTLEYMSPEQAELSGVDIDTRSDIYGLGVMLYELLTGSTPLERARLGETAYAEILKRIREEEPPKPSTRLSGSGEKLPLIAAQRATDLPRLQRMVRGDLDWIAMKALEKDRSRRYETASGFARDVQRFLDGDPVEACPPSAAYRFRKFARKHLAALVTLGLFVGMLMAMSAVSTWQAIRATEAERRATIEASKVILAESRTRHERDRALKAMREFLENDLLAAARPEGQEGGLGRNATIRQAVDAVRPKIARAFKGQPLIEAAVRHTLGIAYRYLGEHDAAIEELERAVKLWQVWLGPDHPDTIESRSNLATAYLDAGRTAEVIAMFEETLKLETARHGSDHPSTLSSRNNLVTAFVDAGRTDEAIALLEETDTLKLIRFGPNDPRAARVRAWLGFYLLKRQKWAQAEPLLRECLAIREKAHPDDWFTFNARSMLGGSLVGQKKYAEAEPHLLLGYAGLKARVPGVPAPWMIRLTEAGQRVVQLYEAWGKRDKAEEWRTKLGLNSPELPSHVFAR